MNVRVAQKNLHGTLIRAETHTQQDDATISAKGFKDMLVEHDTELNEIHVIVEGEVVYSQMEQADADR